MSRGSIIVLCHRSIFRCTYYRIDESKQQRIINAGRPLTLQYELISMPPSSATMLLISQPKRTVPINASSNVIAIDTPADQTATATAVPHNPDAASQGYR
mmetsp:Transcript_20457/g.45514  ORF Transcript_20457/g.45514 Transcript_20457/m.45514 type:complete len:100 (-) Transcript_20457:197-496(-)